MNLAIGSVRIRYALRNNYLRLGALVFIIGFVFSLWSYYGYLRIWKDRLDSRMSEFKRLKQTIVLLQRDMQESVRYKEAMTSLEMLEKRLSSQDSQVAMVEQLNELARSSGVQVKASTFKYGKRDEGVLRSHQEIVLIGSYMQLRDFLKGMSFLPALTVAKETKVERDKDSGNVKARIHLVSYQSVKAVEDKQ